MALNQSFNILLFNRCMALNQSFNTVISADAKGVIEYWDVDSFLMPKNPKISFEYKTETGLYDNQSLQWEKEIFSIYSIYVFFVML